MSVRLKKKRRDVTESRYGQNILSRFSSRRLGMGGGVHTIRDSCYHRKTGAGNMLGEK